MFFPKLSFQKKQYNIPKEIDIEFLRYPISKIKFSEKGIIFLLSKYSFGAYLIHPFVISVLKYLGLNTLTFNSLLAVPIIGVIVFCGSFLISGILNHIPILNKYIV